MLADDLMDELDGLGRYASISPAEVMREIAEIALRRGLTLGTLAKLYDSVRVRKQSNAETQTEPGNVRGHFLAKHPRDTTVLAYARAVGVYEPERYVELFSPRPLPVDRTRDVLSNVIDILRREEAEYPEGATQRVIEHIDSADENLRDLYARAFQKAYVKQIFDLLRQHTDPLDALFEKLPPALDLRPVRRPLGAVPDALWNAWLGTAQYFGRPIADDVAALIVGKLRAAGESTDAMEAELRRRRERLLRDMRRQGETDFPLFRRDQPQ
jgi:hypothetical protein